MKIKIVFTPQALKNIKSVLQSIYKLIQSQAQLPPVYFAYFINSKNIRFLIDSQISPIIIAIGAQMINQNQTTIQSKEGRQMVCSKFQNTQMFFDNLIGVLQKQDSSGLVFQLRKQILDEKQRKFFKLTLRNNESFLSRILVQMPKYDVHQIKYHKWMCGVQDNKKLVQIIIITEQLCNIMRYLIKTKLSSDKKLLIIFNMRNKSYQSRASDQHCRINVTGQFKLVSNNAPQNQNQIEFQINVNDIKIVHEVIRKYKQLKIMITRQHKLVFAFVKQQLYVCHLDMSNWIKYGGYGSYNNVGVTKIQQVQEEEQMRMRMN